MSLSHDLTLRGTWHYDYLGRHVGKHLCSLFSDRAWNSENPDGDMSCEVRSEIQVHKIA